MKSSKRGSSILKVVKQEICPEQLTSGESISNGETSNLLTTSRDAITMTVPSAQKGSIYGWKPDYALAQISMRPEETWLISQAQSITGRLDMSLNEARQIFKEIDITTRQPIQSLRPDRPSGILAALRALVSGGMILLMASGCTKDQRLIPLSNSADTESIGETLRGKSIAKFYDHKEGVVCYVIDGYDSTAINCMVAKPGDNQ